MKRSEIVNTLRVAGYHNDRETFALVATMEPITVRQARLAFASGVQAKRAGVRCNCATCAKVSRS